MSRILFIQTGGTIDKAYPQNDENHGYAFEIDTPASRAVLERAKPELEYKIQTVLKKDSLDITDEDRMELREVVENSSQNMIIITHGTDTIEQTAQSLRNIKNKTIVLTGAMQPERFRDSDADFNIGMATACVQILPPAVYVVLYGKVKEV